MVESVNLDADLPVSGNRFVDLFDLKVFRRAVFFKDNGFHGS